MNMIQEAHESTTFSLSKSQVSQPFANKALNAKGLRVMLSDEQLRQIGHHSENKENNSNCNNVNVCVEKEDRNSLMFKSKKEKSMYFEEDSTFLNNSKSESRVSQKRSKKFGSLTKAEKIAQAIIQNLIDQGKKKIETNSILKSVKLILSMPKE